MSTATPPVPATTAARWDAFRVLLEQQRADCLRERELALAETATSLPDPVSVSRSARLHRTIEEIDEALQRITDGSYGTCVRCAAAIPVERLEFRPFAAACVACSAR